MADLQTGKVDLVCGAAIITAERQKNRALLMDRVILADSVAKSGDPADFVIIDEPLSVSPIATMLRKDDASLKRLGNETTARLVASGEMAQWWGRWFMQPIPPRNVQVGQSFFEATEAAGANLNGRPMEE